MSETPEHGPHYETWCTCADDLNAIDPRPEAQHRLTPAEESKLLARIDESVAKKAQILKQVNEAIAQFGEAMKPFVEQLRKTIVSVHNSFAKIAAEHPEWFDEKPIHPREVRDERGIPKPSNVVPMWADQPNKRRKRR